MAINAVKMTHYTCDIFDCESAQVVGGDDPLPIIHEMGWELGQPIFELDYDLCPTHVQELKAWINGDDPK